jgi:hypothetical protein
MWATAPRLCRPRVGVHSGLSDAPGSVAVTGAPLRGGLAAWQTAIAIPQSQRCARSASMRGCHIADTTISGVRTGRSKPARPCPIGSGFDGMSPRHERGMSATKSVLRAMRIASGKPGTTATTSRLSPSSCSASSTGPVNVLCAMPQHDRMPRSAQSLSGPPATDGRFGPRR